MLCGTGWNRFWLAFRALRRPVACADFGVEGIRDGALLVDMSGLSLYARPRHGLSSSASVSGPVFAFCSHSEAARIPIQHRSALARIHFRHVDDDDWQAMPPEQHIMKVTNPFKRQGLATIAFKVARVLPVSPQDATSFDVEWYLKGDRAWRSGVLPTRGEFLIRKGGRGLQPRGVYGRCA